MSKKCPKCGYIRQSSDIAPEYECPECGIIYAKYEARLEREKPDIEHGSDHEDNSEIDLRDSNESKAPASLPQGREQSKDQREELKAALSTQDSCGSSPWYDNLFLVVFLLVVFWPAGLYGLIKSSRLSSWKKVVFPVGIVMLAGVLFAAIQVDGNIVDLMDNQKIEVTARGAGIKAVVVSARKRVLYPVTVHIPAGTYFVSSNGFAQNMVATQDIHFQPKRDWQKFSVPVACANLTKNIPGTGDTFSIRSSSDQTELVKLMTVLKNVNVSFGIRQAAVWIITDDASFKDLSKLVSGYSGLIASHQVISRQDAALAMNICEKAGIDITKKAIWKDLEKIKDGLEQAE